MGYTITYSTESETKLTRRLPHTDNARLTYFQVRQFFFLKVEKTEIKHV